MDFGKSFKRFLEVSIVFWKLFEFSYSNTIKSEMKTSLKEQVAIIVSQKRRFFKFLEVKFNSLGKLISKFLTLHTYFSKETSKVLGKVQF